MPIELSSLHSLRTGRASALFVGPLCDAACTYLNSKTGLVHINQRAFRHIITDHSDLSDIEIISMSYGLMRGLVVSDNKRPNEIVISYTLPGQNLRWKIAVICCADGDELWIKTFHRTKPRQTKALLARGRIIKPHD